MSCGTGYELTSINTCKGKATDATFSEECIRICRIFSDIDECALGVHDCLPSATCENQLGSYVCIPKQCDAGYITDATGKCIGKEYVNDEMNLFLYYAIDIVKDGLDRHCSNLFQVYGL